MATLTEAQRLLRFDRTTWRSFRANGSLAAAALVTIGAFGVFAFDRFGIQGLLAPRATLRMLLVGFYGWIGLAGAVWWAGRRFGADPGFGTVLRLIGHVHMPLVLVGITIQVLTVSFRLQGPGLVVGLFSALVWMPGMMVAATRELLGLETGTAAAVVLVPYAVWLLVVGGYLLAQVGHLL